MKCLEVTLRVLVETQQFGLSDVAGISNVKIGQRAKSAFALSCVKDMDQRYQDMITHITFINSPEKLRRSEIIVEKICGKWFEDTLPV